MEAFRPIAGTWQHTRISTQPPRSTVVSSLAALTSYSRGQLIYEEGAPVESWYRLVSGAARRCVIRSDGRRRIVDLLLPNDVFGFGGRGKHPFSAEAVSDGTIAARYPRARLELLANSDPRVGEELRDMAHEEGRRLQALILILGRATAQEKVGAFLVHLAERLAGHPADRVSLPISRYDIADYLALSVETVSRALTGLKRSGAIKLVGPRQVQIIAGAAIGS
jgi:CRP/FNR family transcriptional regulator, nitrogen fixation regulation protein